MSLYEMELEQRKTSVQTEESIYYNSAFLILSKSQSGNEGYIKTLIG